MSKHLTLSDRAIIEKYLALDVSFAYIARHLNRSSTTISREIKNHRCFVNGNVYTNNDCANYLDEICLDIGCVVWYNCIKYLHSRFLTERRL